MPYEFGGRLQGADRRADLQGLYGGVGGQQDRLQDCGGDRFGGHHFPARSLGPENGPDVGVGGAGQQRDDADATGAKFFAESVGEAEGSMLAGVVGGGSGEDAGGGDGEIVHDGAAAFHEGERGLRDEECSGEVGFEDILPDGKWKFFYGQVGVGDAGVVDEYVEALELAARGTEEGVDVVWVADVGGVSEDFDFSGGQFPADAG